MDKRLFDFMAGAYGAAIVIGLVVGMIWTACGLWHFHVQPLW